MQRLGASGAAALLVVVELAGCAQARQPLARGVQSGDDRRIEAAQREIEAHERELDRQRAEIEALRARAEMEEQRARTAIETRDDDVEDGDHDRD